MLDTLSEASATIAILEETRIGVAIHRKGNTGRKNSSRTCQQVSLEPKTDDLMPAALLDYGLESLMSPVVTGRYVKDHSFGPNLSSVNWKMMTT